MYGLIVVPNIATSMSMKSRSQDRRGRKVARATSPQGIRMLKAAAT